MPIARKQRTLARTATVSGFGYWSGCDVRLEFRPAPADTGIVFVRHDLPRPARIRATIENRIDAQRRTTLSAGGASVEMVEHVLAALAGLQIDNCEVWIDRPEMPGCDGSSQPFVQALDKAGVETQSALRAQLVVREPLRLGSADSWVEARPARSGGMSLKFRLDYGASTAIGRQTLELVITPDSFRRELAASRTFMLREEADWLVAQGLGKRVTPHDLLIFDAHGPIDNPLRYRDECVRHKALDLVGDLALSGCDLVGHFVAHRSGHRLNAELVRALIAEAEAAETWRRTA
jgi:UDP-3-O-acyl N-acetylglucosamine deacetylase